MANERTSIQSERITIQSGEGKSFGAYWARSPKSSAPVIIIIQEIFGINNWIRSVADYYAEKGYHAVAPDLFWRQEPGIELTDQTEAEWARAFELYQGFDENKGAEDLKATIAHVRKMPGVSGKVGAVGFCLGGKLAYLMSTRTDCDASVGYYGVGIENNLGEKVTHPLCLHMATLDKYVGPDAQKQITDTLGKNNLVTIYKYEEDHAFGRVGGEHYSKASADLAHKRSLEFFQQHLG
jgi:carboxymethylenebutenolidase